jgi:GNAT superfamily N-acetyltransferase
VKKFTFLDGIAIAYREWGPGIRRLHRGFARRPGLTGPIGDTGLVSLPATIDVISPPAVLRGAVSADIPAIVELLAADQLGAARDGVRSPADLEAYQRGFRAIDSDPANLLVIAESGDDAVATLQLTFIPGLARRGALRAQIEAVRVAHHYRGQGIGAAIIEWAISEARERGCALVQLTSDKSRADAHRFYQRLGFTASHEGLKLRL